MNHVYACINQNPCGSTKEYIIRIPYLNYVSGGVVHADTMAGGYEKNDPDLVRYMVDHSAEAIEWLKTIGVNLTGLSTSG